MIHPPPGCISNTPTTYLCLSHKGCKYYQKHDLAVYKTFNCDGTFSVEIKRVTPVKKKE